MYMNQKRIIIIILDLIYYIFYYKNVILIRVKQNICMLVKKRCFVSGKCTFVHKRLSSYVERSSLSRVGLMEIIFIRTAAELRLSDLTHLKRAQVSYQGTCEIEALLAYRKRHLQLTIN